MSRRRAAFTALAFAVFASVTPSPVSAQRATVTVEMSADEGLLEVGKPFALRIAIAAENVSIEDVALPDLAEFDVAARSTSQPMEFGFGSSGRPVMRSTLIHDLTLVPRHGGVFELRPVRVRAGGRSYASDALVIKVDGPEAAASDAATPPADAGTGDPHVDATFDPQVFVASSVDRRSVYVGEPVLVTYYLYQRVDGQPAQTRAASADAFWVHDLMTREVEGQSTIETVRGLQFRVRVVGRFAAFPLRAGSLPIEPLDIELHPTFGGFGFGGGAITRRAPRVVIEAKPLPPPVPSRVAVGRFELSASVEPDRLRTGEATTLTVTIRGDGSLRDVTPEPPSIPGVRVDPPTIEDHVSFVRDVMSSERVLRYMLVPNVPGDVAVPKITLSTFQPASAAYATLETAALTLHVSGTPIAVAQSDADTREATVDEDERRSAIEFGPIRRDSAFERRRTPLSSAPFYPFALLVPPFLFVAAAIARRVVRGSGKAGEPRRAKTGKKYLDDARVAASAGDARSFYSAVARTLLSTIEARVGRSIGSYTHPELRAYLARRGMADDLASRLVDELDGSDFARFSSVAGSREEMQRCLDRVTVLAERLARFAPNDEGAS